MGISLGWPLLVALLAFVALGSFVVWRGRLPVRTAIPWAAVRAAAQLLAVSLVVGFVLGHPALAFGFVAVMFGIGVVTTARRTGIHGWSGHSAVAAAMAAGAVPVLAIIFATGAAPLTGATIVPLGGIIVGNMMTVHTLIGRRAFQELRAHTAEYEAYLALGIERGEAIGLVVSPTLHEALIPALDQTRTVGLVTLPGAYVGVLLGGGSPWEAAAAQVLVLVGINAAQTCVAVVARLLMRRRLLLPADLQVALHP